MSTLVVISRLSSESDPGSSDWVWGHRYGSVVDIGFSGVGGDVLSGRPPHAAARPYDHAGWIQDTFFHAGPSEQDRALGRIRIAEALVQDTYMRGPIDFTGLSVSILLRADAYAAYVAYVGKFPASVSEGGEWDGRISFRAPSRSFRFPKPRGSAKPWDTGSRVTGRLRTIREFEFNQVEIEALGRAPAAADPSSIRATDVQGPLLLRR